MHTKIAHLLETITGGIVVKQTITNQFCSVQDIVFIIIGYKEIDDLIPYFELSINGTSAPPIKKDFYGNETSPVQLDYIRSELIITVPVTPESKDILELMALEQM